MSAADAEQQETKRMGGLPVRFADIWYSKEQTQQKMQKNVEKPGLIHILYIRS